MNFSYGSHFGRVSGRSSAENAQDETTTFAMPDDFRFVFLAVVFHGRHFPKFYGSIYFRLTVSRNNSLRSCKLCKNECHHWQYFFRLPGQLCSILEQNKKNFPTLIPGRIQPPHDPSFPVTHRQACLNF